MALKRLKIAGKEVVSMVRVKRGAEVVSRSVLPSNRPKIVNR